MAATAAAGQVLQDEVRRRAPVLTGNLERHIEAVSTSAATHAQTVVQVASSAPGGTVREAIFEEYGHHTRAGARARWVPPKPFMRPAFESRKTAALNAATQAIEQLLKA